MRGNAARYVDLLGLFLRAHDQDVRLITAAVSDRDWQALRELTHVLKESAVIVGALRIADLAGAIDATAQAGADTEPPDQELQKAVSTMHRVLGDLAAALHPAGL